MARTYSIPVPYKTSFSDGIKIEAALGMSEVQEALKRLPRPLVKKLEAVGPLSHQTFTKAELDSIPQDLWDRLAPHLG